MTHSRSLNSNGHVDGKPNQDGNGLNFFYGRTPDLSPDIAEDLLTWPSTHHVGGISVFHGALDMSRWDALEPWLNEQSEIAHSRRWRYFEDEAGNSYALNEDDNKFTPEQVETAPIRMLHCITDIAREGHDGTPQEFIDVFQDWEDTVYKCLMLYIDKYPYIVNQLWWRTRGHFMRYKTTGHIGAHADCDTNYRTVNGKRYHPMSEFPSRQTVSVTCNLSQSSRDYTGGTFKFPYFDLDLDLDAGDVIIFPANFMGMHEITAVESGDRHAYLCAFGQGTNGLPDPDVAEPHMTNSWTQPVWLNTLHDDYAEVFKKSPEWDNQPFYYNPIAQNRPLEGEGLSKSGGDRFKEGDDVFEKQGYSLSK